MTQQSAAPSVQLSRFGWRDLGLWTAATALVLGAHVAIAYGVQEWSDADASDGGPPPAMVIDMAPMMVAPAIEEQAAMLDPTPPDQREPIETQETITTAEPVTDPSPEPVTEEAEAAPSDPVAQAQPSVTEPTDQPPLDEVVPDIVQAVAPDVVIPLPQPKPVETQVEKKKPVEAKAKKPVDKPKPRQKKEKAAPAKTVVTASADVKPSAKTAAPKSAEAASRSGDDSRWSSRLGAWIKRHTRYPRAASARRVEGNPYVTFTVDASGRVLTARLSRSSGSDDLDRAALSALQGATVPAPPPEKVGTSILAPFVFNLPR
ncbi:energy transducer TonB [Mesorhizobium shangrilense]|uniref:Protein TonB n=1 Tax=Mesorhizobium shangrilense TaxID=460060 RepID=A0ABV2DR54_9HYPH